MSNLCFNSSSSSSSSSTTTTTTTTTNNNNNNVKKVTLSGLSWSRGSKQKITGVTKMAAELEEMAPPFSLHSMDDTGSSGKNTIELGTEEEEEKGQDHKGVFVLREKSGVIHPVDYKYRVGEF